MGYILVVVAGTPLMMSASSTRNMRISLSIASTYFSFGTFVMMIAAPFTIAALGWRGLWHVNAAIFLVVLIALLASIYISDRPGAHRPTHGFSWSDLARSARNPGPWLLSIMFVLMSLCTFSVMAWLPTFLIDKLNYDRTTAALLAGLYVAGMIPFNLLGGLLLQRGVQRWVLFVISAAAIAVFPAGIFASTNPDWARIACAVALALLTGFIPGAVFAAVPLYARSAAESGVVTGTLVQGNALGQLLGPPLLALLVVRSGSWSGSLWFFYVLGGLGFVVAIAVRTLEKRLNEETKV